MLASILVLAAAIMAFGPQTPAGLWLHKALVEIPARLLARIERKHLFFAAIMLILILNVATVGPLDMMMAGMWDVAVFLDIATAVLAVSTLAKSKSAWVFIRNRAAGMIARVAVRRPRSRSSRPRIRRDADDDAGGRALGLRPAYANDNGGWPGAVFAVA